MAQSYIFPSISPSLAGFNIQANSNMDISRVSGHESVTEYAGERWVISLRFSVLRRAEMQLLKTHLLKLRGHANKSIITDTGHQNAGEWGGLPVIDGAGQYGLVVNLKGLNFNETFAQPGDRIRIGGRVHEILDQATADGTGKGTVYLANEIITPTTDGATVFTTNNQQTINCRWTDPKQIQQLQGNKSYARNVRLTFIEALA